MTSMTCRRILQRLVPAVTHNIRCSHSLITPRTLTKSLSRVPLSQPTAIRLMSTAKFEVINIQDEDDFKKKVEMSTTPVVVDFHAVWCGPCKLLAPRLETIVAGKEGKVILAKVNIDDNTDLAIRFGVSSVPTVVGIKGGKILSQFIGLLDDDAINSFVEELIN